MPKPARSHLALPKRAQKLLAAVDEWVLACECVIREADVEPKNHPRDENPELNNVTWITQAVSDAFHLWFTPGARLQLSAERMDYLEYVLNELRDATRKGDGRLANRLHHVLLSLNFNARPYWWGYVLEVDERLKSKQAPEHKIDFLSLHLKFIAQQQYEYGMMFYDRYPSAKECIGGWLMEEIAHLERTTNRYATEPESKGDFFGNGMPMKLMLNASVARLACITRALVEKGIIQNTSVSDLSQLLSKFVVTRRSENVSPQAIRLRYYDIEDATRDSVIQILKELISHVKQLGQR